MLIISAERRVQQCTLTCVDMVSNVVTPKATLAGTDRLSSQNETWRIFIPVYIDRSMTYWRNIKTLMLANLGNKSPMRQWRACKKERRWWADNRRTPSWKPSGSETERPFDFDVQEQKLSNQRNGWTKPWGSCIRQCWSPYCNKSSQKVPAWTW